MSIPVSLTPTQPLECKFQLGSGSVTIPVLSQELLNDVATNQINGTEMKAQIFTMRFSNGDLRNFRITVNNTGTARWSMPNSYRIPSDWFRFRVDFAKSVIHNYLDSAKAKILEQESRRVQASQNQPRKPQ